MYRITEFKTSRGGVREALLGCVIIPDFEIQR
jgi:hypothetical protein